MKSSDGSETKCLAASAYSVFFASVRPQLASLTLTHHESQNTRTAGARPFYCLPSLSLNAAARPLPRALVRWSCLNLSVGMGRRRQREGKSLLDFRLL
ncbi:hypothetical protein RRG08_023130 [Elysia crispata]|uniref:Uncharacterized protein n=1 Tax=Elysia crispata TaxID=231223 RepID=A0AAE0XMT8_9GAST|nr:hypothetical protein RRG08_023130 [Elysia crispata]